MQSVHSQGRNSVCVNKGGIKTGDSIANSRREGSEIEMDPLR